MAQDIYHSDAGFTRVMDPQDARRQLYVSAGILAVMAVAAVAVLATPRFTQVAAARAPITLTVQAPQLVHVQQASAAELPGG